MGAQPRRALVYAAHPLPSTAWEERKKNGRGFPGDFQNVGIELIKRCNECRVIVDCSHTGYRTTMEAEGFYRYLDMDVPTLRLVARYLAAVISAWEELHGTERVFAIEPKEAGRIAGLIRLAIDGGDNRQGNLGFSLDSDYRGRGYATEALGEVARFQRHQMHRANSP